MTTLLIVDTETNGLDPKVHEILEVGAVLYSVDHHRIISTYSELVQGPKVNEAEHKNRIPVSTLKMGQSPRGVLQSLALLAQRADLIVAHRSEFDKSFVDAMQAKWSSQPVILKPWLCSKFDLTWPGAQSGEGLTYLALELGVPVTDAHRALVDCLVLAKCFYRCHELGYDVEEMIRKGLRPKTTLRGMQSFAENEKAKEVGFRFDRDKRAWFKSIAKEDMHTFLSTLPFRAMEVTDG